MATHKEIGEKRQKKRKETNLYKVTEDKNKKKFYVLEMFPYPSGAGLHVGHPKGYIAGDVLARKKMLEGFSVLHPMGFDTFGLGTEQYAIDHKMKPQVVAEKNINTFINQLKDLGLTYDRDRSFSTADPDYYKRTQRIFLKMYTHYYDEKEQKAKPITELEKQLKQQNKSDLEIKEIVDNQRLAYVDYKPINRCPKCMTGLANEDLDDGKCERCGSEVEQKPMRQRVLRITKYADRLITGLDKLNWDESMKDLERNRIGKSVGTQFKMNIKQNVIANESVIASEAKQSMEDSLSFEVYTTRIDTVFGMSFVVMAPEHPLVDQITTNEHKANIAAYKEQAKYKTQLERTELQKDKTGEFTGAYAINPFNREEIPVYVGDYVLANYGTGVVMAVPAHDERDFEFAKKYNIKIKYVIHPTIRTERKIEDNGETTFQSYESINFSENELKTQEYARKRLENDDKPVTGKGKLFYSKEFTGLTSDEAIAKMQERLSKNNIGGKKANFKIQDRVFSRQRYRGEPFPVVFCDDCGIVPMNESDLPLTLPDVENYAPTGTEEGPLAAINERINTTCPACGKPAKRESNTMPGRAGSSRYRLRYMDNKNDKQLVSPENEKYRGNVDVYVGGAEHVTRHMIYARFRQKFLFDIGVVTKEEPFEKYHKVGLIMAEDGRKMSKRRGNVVLPDDIIAEYGADTLRTYEMFMGPFEQAIARSTNGMKGIKKFLDKIVALKDKISDQEEPKTNLTQLHQTIKKLTEDIDGFKFNTAISQLMILVNHLTDQTIISKDTFEKLVILVAPFAPHLAEELWENLGNNYSVFTTTVWPSYDESYLVSDTVKIGVQFNGKIRGDIEINKETTQEDVMQIVKSDPKLSTHLAGEPKKIIYIPGKILNIVI
ncbi:MAG: leucine--tRNA ligase [Candidatus Absconditabacteria bacterium]|nr:leucine--tRNA ligase [Candidatus Absconditabacteria bacterium]